MTNNHIKNINQQGGDKELGDKNKIKEYFKENSQNDVVAILQKYYHDLIESESKA